MESGRACATDRGSGGLGLAEGIVLKLFFHGYTSTGSFVLAHTWCTSESFSLGALSLVISGDGGHEGRSDEGGDLFEASGFVGPDLRRGRLSDQ